MKSTFYSFLALLMIAALACNSPKNSGENAVSDSTQPGAVQSDTAQAATTTDRSGITQLEGTYWKLVELNGKPVTMAENQTREQHMILQPSDSTVKGHGGCNGFGGNYELKPGDRIKFSKIVSTMMACENTETENAFFKVLEMADNYNLVGDSLVLNKARMAPLARFKAVYMQ